MASMLQPGDPGGVFPPEGFLVLACLVLLLGGWGGAGCAVLRPELVSKPTLGLLLQQLHISGIRMGDPTPTTKAV